MLNLLVSLLPTVVVLGVLIFVHEMGHFLACKVCKVRVEKFSIGFGPPIFSWKRKDTQYVIALIPFGGFVKPAGETHDDIKERGLEKDDYLAQSAAKKLLIVVSGVLLNYLLAFLLFVTVFFAGRPVLSTVVGELVDGYPAVSAGIKKGDKVFSVDGVAVKSWADLTALIHGSGEKTIKILVDRNRKELSFTLKPTVDEVKTIFGESKSISRIGIYPSQEVFIQERFGLVESIEKGADAVLSYTVLTYKAIFYLVTGRLSLNALSGPVGILAITAKTAHLGIVYLMQLTALLSVSLAVFNLLPIPALDGGHLLFLAIGAIRRKDVSYLTQERITQVGFTVLIVLLIIFTYNDIVRLNLFQKIGAFFCK